jgi:hypothetical protein
LPRAEYRTCFAEIACYFRARTWDDRVTLTHHVLVDSSTKTDVGKVEASFRVCSTSLSTYVLQVQKLPRMSRVARWNLLRPKISIGLNFIGSWNRRC